MTGKESKDNKLVTVCDPSQSRMTWGEAYKVLLYFSYCTLPFTPSKRRKGAYKFWIIHSRSLKIPS
ncbi:MAG: hypothetical protein CME68_10950 [Halobacteriovoraceae bacterium]|nr:hypothetical protein [Halobacteriovoraceae bacterium]